MKEIMLFFERHSFGVCTYLGERFGISISKLRLFFIYTTVLAAGFPIIFYMLAGVVLDIRNYVKRIRYTVRDF